VAVGTVRVEAGDRRLVHPGPDGVRRRPPNRAREEWLTTVVVEDFVTVLVEELVKDVTDLLGETDDALAVGTVLERRRLIRPVAKRDVLLAAVVAVDAEAAEGTESGACVPREFIASTALAVTVPTGTGVDDAPATRECDLCGAEHPADMVNRTTVPEIAPFRADVCWTCQFVHEHTPREGTCAQCGDTLDEGYPGTGYSIEIEYPLGVGDEGLPAHKSAKLCGECAAWIGSDINHRGITNDPVASERYSRFIAFESERIAALEADDA